MMKNEDAASLVLRSDLSQDQCNIIKSQSYSRSAHFLPTYDYMLDEKKKTYLENIVLTETKTSVPLKNMMERTFDNIMEDPTFKEIEDILSENGNGHDASKFKCKVEMGTYKISSLPTCHIIASFKAE